MESEPENIQNERQVKSSNSGIIIAVLATILAAIIIYNLGLLRSIGFSPANAKNASTVRSASSAAPVITMETEDFFFERPADWRELTAAELKIFDNQFPVGISRSKPPALMWIKVSSIKGAQTSIKDLPGRLDKVMTEKFDNFKRIDSEFVNISGERGLKYAYEFNSVKNKIRISQTQYIVFSKNKAYYLIFQAKSSDIKSISGDINAIADSFKIK